MRVDVAASPRDAPALARPEEPDGLVCVAGSLSLIGDILTAEGDDEDVLFQAGSRC